MFHHGKPDRAHDRIIARVEREVVEHDVARGEAELGVDAGQRLDRVLADEIDFGVRLGLRVGDEDDVERPLLDLGMKREIDRGRQWPGRREALECEVELSRRALGLMMAIEARQIGQRIDRRHEAGGLQDEDRRLVRERQPVAPVGAGDRDVAAVRNEHVGEARIGRARCAGTVPVLEHGPRDGRLLRPRLARLECGIGQPARRPDEHITPRHSALGSEHISASDFDEAGMRLCRRDGRVKGRGRIRVDRLSPSKEQTLDDD